MEQVIIWHRVTERDTIKELRINLGMLDLVNTCT
jgi:hypothetical protein